MDVSGHVSETMMQNGAEIMQRYIESICQPIGVRGVQTKRKPLKTHCFQGFLGGEGEI